MAGEYLGQKSFHHLITWQQLCVHILTTTQCRKAEIKSSCAWRLVDNDVNTSHSKRDKETMGQKKEVIFVSSIILVYSWAPELLRLWEQNSFFCIHGQKRVHTGHNKQAFSHSEVVTGNDVHLEKHLFPPTWNTNRFLLLMGFTHCLEVPLGISGFLA